MQNYYNTNQLSLSLKTDFIPEENHEARFIDYLVESIEYQKLYITGRPREYDSRALLKLVLFSYLRGSYSCRQIERIAKENIYARWLTQELVPSYRTIARFIISDETDNLILSSFDQMRTFLKQNNLIDDAVFIDGTKILANANKYSFVWRKNIERYDELNQLKAQELIKEIKTAQQAGTESLLPIECDDLDVVIALLEQRIDELDKQVEETKKISPNPAKKVRRKAKSYLHKSKQIRNKEIEYNASKEIFGDRNSYSKTDHDATFMRVKEDPMNNGQLKPGYNLQIATSNQFVLDYDLYWNPTDTRTLIPFVQRLDKHQTLGKYIVADAGYGSESNYRYLNDYLPDQVPLIPYGTMLKENSKKWKSDDRKVMNWDYYDQDDYYIDPNGVRFNFYRYVEQTDQYGFKRQFKKYRAETTDIEDRPINSALTPKGYVRYIQVNPEWEYFKAKEKEQLSEETNSSIYARRKIDVESCFGHLKAYLRFNRFTVRGQEKVHKQMGLALMAMNMGKLAKTMVPKRRILTNKEDQDRKNPILVLYFDGVMSQPLLWLNIFFNYVQA